MFYRGVTPRECPRIAWDGTPDWSQFPQELAVHDRPARAAEFVGRAGSTGHGVIAIAHALPNFRRYFLYQNVQELVVQELVRVLTPP